MVNIKINSIMKNMIIIGLLLCLTQFVIAQSHTAKFSNSSGEKKIRIIKSKGEIFIIAHNSSEVIAATDDYKAPPERARGLRPLYNNAIDNTGMGLEINESGNVMTIKTASNKDMDFELKVPVNADIYIEETDWNGNGIRIKDVQGELEIEAKGSDVKIANAAGPVVASTVNGDIEVNFTSVNQDQPNSISCTNGFVDITIPTNTKADLKMKSINGEVYTDFDIDMEKSRDGMKRLNGHNLSGTINGGGVGISLRAINSDIYLRKGK